MITNYLYGREEPGIFEHGCFLYGYDDEEGVFYSQSYLKDEKCERVTIPYDVFYKALSYFPEKGEIDFIGYRLVRGFVWDSNCEKIQEEICSYGNSAGNSGKILDMSAEKAFFEGICRGSKVHYPSLYCMYEHKVMMQRRLDFLMAQGIVVHDKENLPEQMRQIQKGYRKLLLMGVSYNLRPRDSLMREMVKMADTLMEKEGEFMEKLQIAFK